MSSKRVLVTGAAGFVGAVLTRRLLGGGHEVHVLVKPGTPAWRLTGVETDLHWHRADLRDEAAMRAAVAAARPQVIYHLAAHGAYPSQADASGILATNVLGTYNLLKAAAKIDYEVLVNTGSSSEYGFKDHPMQERDLLEPNSYYAVAKSGQTLLCRYVARAEQRPVTTLRLFSVYGPFEEPSRLVPTLVRRCLDGQDLTLANPQTVRDFVYVDDVADAYLRVEHLAKLPGRIINIGSGIQTSLREIVDIVIRQTEARVHCNWGTMPSRSWDTETWVADRSLSKRLLDWEPTTTLAEGLARTVAWIKERRAVEKVA